jgi:hypothetical protein
MAKAADMIRALGILTMIVTFHPPAGGHADAPAFTAGEKLEYELRWENVVAGSASLEVMPQTTVNGQPAHHFVMTVRSSKIIDMFYKVRNRIDAYADLSMTRSLHYRKKQHEGRHKRDETVRFEWQENRAHYSNYGRGREPIELMEGSFDPLSALYYTRTNLFEIGGIIERPVTDGKKNVVGRLTVHERESITLQNGRKYDTYRIEPELCHVGGVFKEGKGARIELWVTADERRIPVRIRSKAIIGSFIGELVSAEGVP